MYAHWVHVGKVQHATTLLGLPKHLSQYVVTAYMWTLKTMAVTQTRLFSKGIGGVQPIIINCVHVDNTKLKKELMTLDIELRCMYIHLHCSVQD